MSRPGVNDDVGEGEAAAGAAALDVEAGATAEAGAESFGAAEQKQGSARGRLALSQPLDGVSGWETAIPHLT